MGSGQIQGSLWSEHEGWMGYGDERKTETPAPLPSKWASSAGVEEPPF